MTATAPGRGASLIPPGTTELLAPARDLEAGRAAINCGADAVYIGAARFGAREAAANPLDDIAALVAHAHQYWARVYVALNTLLFDGELTDAERLAWQLHEIGADALIIQDAGLLESNLPPLPLIASTQMHNNTADKVAFLERVGFHRAILARELSLDEIRTIRRAAPHIELECFVHGALCVCYSGQCYLSLALGGRSANRGQCAQPCRKPYRLIDGRGRVVHERSHLLSLHDLNLAEHLPELIAAGVTSFKIEGRLKDTAYVANVVAHYRDRLDVASRERGLGRSSSGRSAPGFAPDPDKTFHRGYTDYFLHGRKDRIGRPATPKMLGEEVGRVTKISQAAVSVATRLPLAPGDGVCFFDREGELRGTLVNAVRGGTISLQNPAGVQVGMLLYRNHDHVFLSEIKSARMQRRIAVSMSLRCAADGVTIAVRDEDGVEVTQRLACTPEAARDPENARDTIHRQLMKTGQSIYACSEITVDADPVPFLAVSALNALRRSALDALTMERTHTRPRVSGGAIRNGVPYPEKVLPYLGNVLNKQAVAFYSRHGVTRIEPAAESGLDLRTRKVMTTRYCIKDQLGLCSDTGTSGSPEEPLYLVDDEGHRLRLIFDCSRCGMDVFLE